MSDRAWVCATIIAIVFMSLLYYAVVPTHPLVEGMKDCTRGWPSEERQLKCAEIFMQGWNVDEAH